MEDFRYQMTVDISGKTHSAMISFLQKHGQTSHDVSAFVEEAITWLMVEREMDYLHGKLKDEIAAEEGGDKDEESELLAGQLAVENRHAA